MSKRTEKFPKEIYVGHESDGEGGSFLVANETPEGMEVTNDERRVAVYEFVRVAKLVNKTEVI